jgi:hypothetical protein
MCVDEYLQGKIANPEPDRHCQDMALFTDFPHIEDTNFDDFPTNGSVVDHFSNAFIGFKNENQRNSTCPLRDMLRQRMHDHGLRFDSSVENASA